MTRPEPTPLRAWWVWGIALVVYMLAIFHRSSLAVAGLAAADRFGISASQLATFTMLQLLVYAGMQVPVGVLVDRFGSRRVLTVGLVLMTLAQAGFAWAESYPAALVARVFVGVGDSMTFICVLRMVSSWFPARRIPLVSQLTGSVGQLGAIAAAIPMTWALGHLGWTRAYLCAAAIGVVLLVAMLVVVHDSPHERVLRGEPLPLSALGRSIRDSWAQPGTRLGFWMHFSTPFSVHAFSLLWGFPFLVRAQGMTPAGAGVMLTLITVVTISSGPVLGWVVGNHPYQRSTVTLGVVGSMMAVWGAVLLWPGQAPLWLVVLLMVVIGIGGPTSMIGFDMGRTSNPLQRYATATGIINQGGFVAALLTVVAIGVVLDAQTPAGSSAYTPEAFRWAMSVQYVPWVLGVMQVWRYRTRVRALVSRGDVQRGSTMVTPPAD